jgi:hypothetical protein
VRRRTYLLRGWIALLIFSPATVHAGGPEYVAGKSYFDPAVKGLPLTWAQGAISYYTDQGDLSPILPGASTDSFVASAFALWTSIPTAAVSAIRSGQLAEDVNSTNINAIGGSMSMPADILPGATATPVAIVYDNDGAVTDELLGSGASSDCAANSVIGGIDNLAPDAHFLHALIVLNGVCAQTSSQLPDLRYHLVRTIGRVLGLDWSQANVNVITRNPPPSSSDIAGFPVMHEIDPRSCVPVSICYSNNGTVDPAQPKPDDQAALSRLYPVTPQNVGNFSGKRVFSQSTARIRGSVYFTDAAGLPGQPMQGVNVVARWTDPATRQSSGAATIGSISGFLFCGNSGNPVTGYADSTGQNFDQFGSDDIQFRGFFDLAGLQIPPGATSAQYQISVEAVDPTWSTDTGPYGTSGQVQPSGAAQPILITVTRGADVAQDIVMQGAALQKKQWYGSTTYDVPLPVPKSGNWSGALQNYGAANYFQFSAKANRTLSVVVNALDEKGNVSEGKTMPVAGMWSLANPGQFPAPEYFIGLQHFLFWRNPPGCPNPARHDIPPGHSGLPWRRAPGFRLQRASALRR